MTSTASPWVARFAPRIRKGGVVLDLASGGGRHTRYLRDLGFQVVAADIDVSRIADLQSDGRVEILRVDLETEEWPLGDRRFDGIVVTNYLHRPNLPRLIESLNPGGVLIYESFAKGQETIGRPRNPAFLLNPAELIDAFGSQLTIVAYEHGIDDGTTPAVRQRICAINGG